MLNIYKDAFISITVSNVKADIIIVPKKNIKFAVDRNATKRRVRYLLLKLRSRYLERKLLYFKVFCYKSIKYKELEYVNITNIINKNVWRRTRTNGPTNTRIYTFKGAKRTL